MIRFSNHFPVLLKFVPLIFMMMCYALIGHSQEGYKANWVLVYENDEEGNSVQGSKAVLINAIRNGEMVRISWTHVISEDPLQKVEHLVDAGYLTIMNDETVLAQVSPIISQAPDFEEQHIILMENVEMGLVASTTGKNNYIRRNAITGEVIDHKSGRRGYKWFVHK